MQIKIATVKSTGQRFFYSTRTDFGQRRYTADCSGADLKPSWWNTLTEARRAATERGMLETVPAHIA